jgi:flavin-dependent dehydrogenase
MAALEFSRQGATVLLVDRAAFPRSKVCGACLNPFALALLRRVGLGESIARAGAAHIHQMSLAAGRSRANIPLIGWRVLSRLRLDMTIVTAAQAAGARFMPGTQAVLGPIQADRRVLRLDEQGERVEVGARLVVAASGLGGGFLRGEESFEAQIAPGSRIGLGTTVDSFPASYAPGIIYMAYGSGGYAGLVQTEDGALNIAAALELETVRQFQNPGAAVTQILDGAGSPAIANLARMSWHGTPPLTRSVSRPAWPRVLAIGDASGYIEPFTGEGIGWALASGARVAQFAGPALQNWQPDLEADWISVQKKVRADSGRLCRAITWVSRRPKLARGLVGCLGRWPRLANPLLRRIASA